MTDMLDALVFYVVFVLSVTVHEAAHAWAAKLGGDLTAYHGGQVSLDPIPHIRREPLGMVLLPLITLSLWGWPFGFASAPYDPGWAERHPRRAAWMALAGPGANLGLLLLAALAIRIGLGLGAFEAPAAISFQQVTTATGTDEITAVGFFLSLLFSMNLLLFLLNMLPVPPLDGSGALPLVLPGPWQSAWRNLMRQPMLGWIGLFVAWQVFGAIFWPCFVFAINLLYPGIHYGR